MDIVERLEAQYMDTKHMLPCALEHEAADEITRLRTEVAIKEHCIVQTEAEVERLRSDLALAQGQRDASEREAELLRDENAVLRWVYEAARRVLRFDGVDAGAVKIALIDMDMAIERVKLLDSGQWE